MRLNSSRDVTSTACPFTAVTLVPLHPHHPGKSLQDISFSLSPTCGKATIISVSSLLIFFVLQLNELRLHETLWLLSTAAVLGDVEHWEQEETPLNCSLFPSCARALNIWHFVVTILPTTLRNVNQPHFLPNCRL